jgi:hypothetical protein
MRFWNGAWADETRDYRGDQGFKCARNERETVDHVEPALLLLMILVGVIISRLNSEQRS